MVSSTLIAALAGALPLVYADYYYPSANATVSYAPSATGTAKPSVQTVSVGKDGLVFTPDTITAKVGEEIEFQFFPKNHSVVQADFNNPCNPSEGGIFSGFIPSPAGAANKTFTITVKDDKPIWLYCAALLPKPHCAQGMVAVINPPANSPNTLDAFRQLASTTNTSTAPSNPSGGDVENTPPTPSSSGTPPDDTGAASALVASGSVVGFVAAFAAFML
jgi:plastocyanin